MTSESQDRGEDQGADRSDDRQTGHGGHCVACVQNGSHTDQVHPLGGQGSPIRDVAGSSPQIWPSDVPPTTAGPHRDEKAEEPQMLLCPESGQAAFCDVEYVHDAAPFYQVPFGRSRLAGPSGCEGFSRSQRGNPPGARGVTKKCANLVTFETVSCFEWTIRYTHLWLTDG